MQLVRCEHGHYYDATKYPQCPHCEVYGNEEDPGYTVAKAPARGVSEPSPDDQSTVALAREKLGFDPIAGWLVCVKGAARGQDYHIHNERNFLGRSDRMDICVKGDLGISRENHAVISYNPKARSFSLIPGDGKSIIYLNGQEVLAPVRLTAYDRIEISATVLVFIPLCSEIFSWDDEANQ